METWNQGFWGGLHDMKTHPKKQQLQRIWIQCWVKLRALQWPDITGKDASWGIPCSGQESLYQLRKITQFFWLTRDVRTFSAVKSFPQREKRFDFPPCWSRILLISIFFEGYKSRLLIVRWYPISWFVSLNLSLLPFVARLWDTGQWPHKWGRDSVPSPSNKLGVFHCDRPVKQMLSQNPRDTLWQTNIAMENHHF